MRAKAQISLKNKIIIILLSILLPLAVLINLFAFYIQANYIGQVADLNRASLQKHAQYISNSLHGAEKSMLEIIGGNNDFRRLIYLMSELDAHTINYNVATVVKNTISSHPDISAIVVYSPVNDTYYPTWAARFTGSNYAHLKDKMRDYVKSWDNEKEDNAPAWNRLELEGTTFLQRVLYHQNASQKTYLFCFVDLDHLSLQGDRQAAFVSGDSFITFSDIAKENSLDFPKQGESYIMTGSPQKYMLLCEDVPNTDVQAAYLIKTEDIYEGAGLMYIILLVLSVVAILAIPLGYLWISRTLFRPIADLVNVMETAANGDLTARVQFPYKEPELRTMSKTFNSMMDQIKELKIESYEKELTARQAQLNFLQLQIRPHFYINCLKNIYGLAQQQQYADIQGMLVVLSDYLRYMMQCDRQWVPLEEELQNSRNYIQLLRYNMAYPPECTISVDTAVLNTPIPPITILSFVENSIKYAKPESQLKITIQARQALTDDGPVFVLTVQDNGEGFNLDKLDILNHFSEASSERTHVGLYNVWQRLKILYNNKHGIVFSNKDGARIEVFLPIGETNDFIDS